jgi:hypothetical protein
VAEKICPAGDADTFMMIQPLKYIIIKPRKTALDDDDDLGGWRNDDRAIMIVDDC